MLPTAREGDPCGDGATTGFQCDGVTDGNGVRALRTAREDLHAVGEGGDVGEVVEGVVLATRDGHGVDDRPPGGVGVGLGRGDEVLRDVRQ